ncbi:hypothetical protein Cgig2_032107 [Carnegiea gigantea]|uniref:Uncharacterized protein n=1 Tax=Carnegiea gigantea TaxID=171969 RepID=A0A9Q1K303_9CARY|nr:hypothetical protein Cgig2_032107 [Carnegiea gigantea]
MSPRPSREVQSRALLSLPQTTKSAGISLGDRLEVDEAGHLLTGFTLACHRPKGRQLPPTRLHPARHHLKRRRPFEHLNPPPCARSFPGIEPQKFDIHIATLTTQRCSSEARAQQLPQPQRVRSLGTGPKNYSGEATREKQPCADPTRSGRQHIQPSLGCLENEEKP